MLKIKIATKDIILSNRKQQYQKNVEVDYKRNPQPKKDAARAASKVNYAINPQPKKDAARYLACGLFVHQA